MESKLDYLTANKVPSIIRILTVYDFEQSMQFDRKFNVIE